MRKRTITPGEAPVDDASKPALSDIPKIPNAETRAALAEADGILRERRARFENAYALFRNLENPA
jgi:hypothetical protein